MLPPSFLTLSVTLSAESASGLIRLLYKMKAFSHFHLCFADHGDCTGGINATI